MKRCRSSGEVLGTMELEWEKNEELVAIEALD